MNTKISFAVVILALAGIGYLIYSQDWSSFNRTQDDAIPQNVTLSGTYVCLPHIDTEGPQTEECALGMHADDGKYYALDFGQSAQATEEFQDGKYFQAEGFVVPKMALSSDHWQKYDMEGVFVINKILEPSSNASGKINIQEVCQSALAYMTFPDAAAAEVFVAECIEGKHPEVIESYKAQFELDGAAI